MASLRLPYLAHGADYNPDQWLRDPEILSEDIRLMKAAGCTVMSVGIFAWTALEPSEGVYTMDWLKDLLDRLYENGIHAFLATPSGARPAWMSQKYPEVLRVAENGLRNPHGKRHNHCLTSPVYREFVRKMNGELARRFGHHPAVVGWHISNEYSGACHCELCQDRFRGWLKARYGTLDAINRAWWTGFWSKTYTEWDQLHSPTEAGEDALHGLNLAWHRFTTEQTADFLRAEIQAVREFSDLPVTTNLMEFFGGLDYHRLAKELDFVSYDSYPLWGVNDMETVALTAGFNFDLMRSLKRQSFILMESTPSQVNWQEVCKLKKPGVHLLSSLQAVAHGSDSVMYFQWRKSRGGSEKFHGAVVGHSGHENTRVFRDVQSVSALLAKLNGVQGSLPDAKAALIYDSDNRLAIADCQGPRREKHYMETLLEHYRALKRASLDVDVISPEDDFAGYRLISAPMLYMLKPGVAERLTRFVEDGGILVCTCLTGRVDEDDLCFLGGFPGPLRRALGIWIEDTDALRDGETNLIAAPNGKSFTCSTMCDLIHAETAQVVAAYGRDFYAGTPAVTVNRLGKGEAIYIASRPEQDYLDALYASLPVPGRLIKDMPKGVQAVTRGNTLFVMNFSGAAAKVALPEGTDLLTGEAVRAGLVEIEENGFRILKDPKPSPESAAAAPL